MTSANFKALMTANNAWTTYEFLHTYNKIVSSGADISEHSGHPQKTTQYYSNVMKLILALPMYGVQQKKLLQQNFAAYLLHSLFSNDTTEHPLRDYLETFGSTMGYLSDAMRSASAIHLYTPPRNLARIINTFSSASLFYQSSKGALELVLKYRAGQIGIDRLHSVDFVKRVACIAMALIFAKKAILDKSTPAKILTTIVAIEALARLMLYHKTRLLGAPPEKKEKT